MNIDPQAAAASLQAAGFPVELGNVPYASRRHAGAGQDRPPVDARAARSTLRGSLFDLLDENADPFGGIVARSAGAVLLRTDWFVSASETDVLSSSWLNEARFQFARFDQQSRSLDPRCDGPCDLDDEGGPLLILQRRGHRGPQRQHAAGPPAEPLSSSPTPSATSAATTC